MKILDVMHGPVHSSEWPDWDDADDGFDFPYGQAWILVCKYMDDDGKVDIDEFHFEDREGAMEIVNHIFGQIIPFQWSEF